VNAGTDATRSTGGEQVLGLLADPGLPAEIVDRVVRREDLPALLNDQTAEGSWRVETAVGPLRLDTDGKMPTAAIGRETSKAWGWDAVVLVTDLPRRAGTEPVVADVSTAHRTGLVSVPALGALNLRRRAQRTILRLVSGYLGPAPSGAPKGGDDATISDAGAPVHHIDGTEEGIDHHVALRGLRGRTRLLSGMVRANRPWLLVPSLSPAIAGAAAGAAFGVFYSNIWTLADAFTGGRLALVGALAVVSMIAWLIVDNGLWERPSNRTLRAEAALYNAVTVATISTAVVYMYVLLSLATLAATFVVIPSALMTTTLGHPATFGDYAGLAWLATSMGTIAGALGSGLAGEETVRRAAYSRREEERRERMEQESEEAQARQESTPRSV
jgi:hypothetical protein